MYKECCKREKGKSWSFTTIKPILFYTAFLLLLLCSCEKQGDTEKAAVRIDTFKDIRIIMNAESIEAVPIKAKTLTPSLPVDSEPLSVAQMFRAVLLDEMPFSGMAKDFPMHHYGFLSELPYGYDDKNEICRFAVADLDGDAVPEVAGEIEGYSGYMILRYREGKIYGNFVDYRAMMLLKKNGASIGSSGAGNNVIQKFYFIGDTFFPDDKVQHYEDAYSNVYYINDVLAEESLGKEVETFFYDIPGAEWHDLTEETVDKYILENPAFTEIPMETPENIRERQAYLDSLSYLLDLTYTLNWKIPEEYNANGKSYYNGCYDELNKIYQLCQESLSGEALESLTEEQRHWEESSRNMLEEDLQKLYISSIDEQEKKYLYYSYGDLALRRTLALINMYYDYDFYNWVEKEFF